MIVILKGGVLYLNNRATVSIYLLLGLYLCLTVWFLQFSILALSLAILLSELQTLDFVSFSSLFYFLFTFIFYFPGTRVRVQHNIICHYHKLSHISHNYMTLSQSYYYMLGQKAVKGSERNDIIQHVIHMLILRQMHSYLEQAKVAEYGPLVQNM